MLRTRLASCLAIPALAGACHAGAAKEPSRVGEAEITAAIGTGSAAAAAERMPHCPSVVPGATTVVSEIEDGVALRVTASGDEDAEGEIRRRANYLATQAGDRRGRHRADGAVGGEFGRCPVVMRNTRIEVREIPGGAAILVRPQDATELAWLRRESEARSAQLSSPRPFGPGLMAACPNAVPNAVTRIADAPHGVEMSVTGSSEDEIRQIKERAKRLALPAAAPGARGSSSGPLAARPASRCAAVLPNTMVFVEETPEGVRLAIKAKNPRDVPDVRSAARESLPTAAGPVAR